MQLGEREGVTFVQFSDKLLTPDPTMRDYYRASYHNMEGYYLPEHYMEIPFWIPTIAGMLSKQRYEARLHTVEDLDLSEKLLANTPPGEILLFSVMDANVQEVKRLVQRVSRKMILGGYTDPKEFEVYGNVQYLGGLDKVSTIFDTVEPQLPDYSLFAGERCIPRLTLSTGCLFRCAFCTVDTQLNVASPEFISGQVEAFKPLDYKLIFIDDKSFGQAENWTSIQEVGNQVREHNTDFLGFIVQTPPSLAIKDGLLEKAYDLGVKYLELGVETVDDKLLELLKKPYRVHHLKQVSELARKIGVKVIPNFILGIPGDTYEDTIKWVEDNADIIPVVNINFLAIHHGNVRGSLPWSANNTGDRDQNVAHKSWLTEEEVIRMQEAMKTIYALTGNRMYAAA